MDMVPFILLRQHLLGLADEKLHIFDAVSPGILPGVLNGLGNDLHAVDLPGLLRQKRRNGPDAAIKVPDRFAAGKICKFQGRSVKLFRLHRIHLVKGKRRDPVFDITDGVCDIAGAVKVYDPCAHDHVGPLGVDRIRYAGDAGLP